MTCYRRVERFLIRLYQRCLTKYTRPCPRPGGPSCSQLALDVGLLAALPQLLTCECFDDHN